MTIERPGPPDGGPAGDAASPAPSTARDPSEGTPMAPARRQVIQEEAGRASRRLRPPPRSGAAGAPVLAATRARIEALGLRRGPARRAAVLVALAVLVVTCVVLAGAVVAKANRDAAMAGRVPHGYVPAGTLPLIDVVGDESTFTAGAGAKTQWTSVAGTALHAQVDRFVDPTAGYTRRRAGTVTVSALAANVDPDASVVVLVGGRNDSSASAASIAAAATRAVSVVRTRAPQAAVVVVAPLIGSTDARTRVRGALQGAAALDDARFVDPNAWFQGRKGLVHGKSRAVTEAGQRELARRFHIALAPLVQR